MTAARPFASVPALEVIADVVWSALAPGDWLQAFAAHPRIGSRGGGAWSAQEQSGVADSARARLAQLNRDYEARFGHVFIVCATGRSGAEMQATLERRMENNPDDELRQAAEEQRRITRLRLEKLLT